MTALDAADDQLARAVGKNRERAGDDRDVVWLVETIERRPDAVRKLLSRGKRGGKSVRQATANARRNEALRTLRANLWPSLKSKSHAAATLIVATFRRYESDRWPRECDAVVAPLDEPQRTFWMILRDHEAGGPMMPDVRQLTTILKSKLD